MSQDLEGTTLASTSVDELKVEKWVDIYQDILDVLVDDLIVRFQLVRPLM